MARVLITGGAGFIGSHLCESLLDEGYFVVCLDNLITGNIKNIQNLQKNANFKFIKADVTKKKDYSDRLGNIEYIFHLASPASPIDYQRYPEETLLTNSIGTLNILDITKKLNTKTLITSTSEIYGDPRVHPQPESYWGNTNSYGPRSCYDESKRFAEAATYVFSNKYKLNARIIRIFNTYGPRMQKEDGRVISNFVNQAINNNPITIYGEGTHTRSFCYVSDMVEGIKKAMFTSKTGGEVFNLGNPEEYKVIDMAKKIKKMTKSKSEFIKGPLPTDDPSQRKPDISKAKKILNWEPKVSLDEGLKETIKYYKSL